MDQEIRIFDLPAEKRHTLDDFDERAGSGSHVNLSGPPCTCDKMQTVRSEVKMGNKSIQIF